MPRSPKRRRNACKSASASSSRLSQAKVHSTDAWTPRRSLTIDLSHSIREVSAGEEEDGQWRRHSVCHDLVGIRELCRGIEDLPVEISRSEFRLTFPALSLSARQKHTSEHLN